VDEKPVVMVSSSENAGEKERIRGMGLVVK
jgi:hypothetical protein